MPSPREKSRWIILSPYNPTWQKEFAMESSKLKKLIGKNCKGIYHIGSTAIPHIVAKPIIDILIVVDNLSGIDKLNSSFEGDSYICMGEYGIPGRRYYWKGTQDKHTHHIHLFATGNAEIERHLAFKQYLIEHKDIAQGYSNIKLALKYQFPDNMESYVEGKESFIRMVNYRSETAKKDQLAAKDDIVLENHNPKWKKLAAFEIDAIQKMVNVPFQAMEHLGSTAIFNIKAKPIIDIFIALKSIEEVKKWVKPLEALGYLYWAENPNKSHHRFFKGMPPYGLKRTHHVHIMAYGTEFKKRVAFRDILVNNKTIANEYEALKCKLLLKNAKDREQYTASKLQFINDALVRKA